MDVNKFANLNAAQVSGGKVGSIQGGVGSTDLGKSKISPDEFAKALQQIDGVASKPKPEAPVKSEGVTFSKHAVDRIQSRGISMGADGMKRLDMALEKAQAKGSKETLVLMDDFAFIMSVKNKKIITAMDKGMMKENLFTNIDSTIIV